MSPTPLSDHISALLENPDDSTFTAFVEAFLEAGVGLEAQGLPGGQEHGGQYQIQEGDAVHLPRVVGPDGASRLRACADPDTFSVAFPNLKITAMMTGRALLEMALMDPDLDGVLVCSATSEHSVPIRRQVAVQLVGSQPSAAPTTTAPLSRSAQKPWWKFW